jgi:hypothetical protein
MFQRLETNVKELQRNIKVPRRRAGGFVAATLRRSGRRVLGELQRSLR